MANHATYHVQAAHQCLRLLKLRQLWMGRTARHGICRCRPLMPPPCRSPTCRVSSSNKALLLCMLASSATKLHWMKIRPAFKVGLLADHVLLIWPWLNLGLRIPCRCKVLLCKARCHA